MSDEITPLPWLAPEFWEKRNGIGDWVIEGNKGWADSGMMNQRTIAIVGDWKDRPTAEADAAYIVLSANAFPALMRVLEAVESAHRNAWANGKPTIKLQHAVAAAREALS